MPHRNQLSVTQLHPDDARTLREIIGLGVIESRVTMQPNGWIYLRQNTRYEDWKMYEVTVAGVVFTLKAENLFCIKNWAAKKFKATTRYSVVLVTRTEVLDGVVLFEEKKPFERSDYA